MRHSSVMPKSASPRKLNANWHPRLPPVKGPFRQAQMVTPVREAVGEMHGPALVDSVLHIDVHIVWFDRTPGE